ncbi:hypothetical protein HPB49_007352 [Dermacentor silvarum]|uniref:Uncharacterized protein n=1 Tax=Dermacentor silvarum TaxID=543639 RepID=A0ACB8CWH9_DERSI|nr:hypothetical protein HPB49_007352 [Dermacentor silvarum]
MAAPSRAIIVQPATSCVPSTTPGGEELMDAASAAVSVTDKSKRQTRTQRALPDSAAWLGAKMHVKKSTIVNDEEWRVSSSKIMLAIRKAASLQAEWSSHDHEEGFEGGGLWERATTRSRERNSERGHILLKELQAAGVILANDLDYPTHHALHSGQRDSTPDLTWMTPALVNDWRCGADRMDIDHYPIWIEVEAKATGQEKNDVSRILGLVSFLF